MQDFWQKNNRFACKEKIPWNRLSSLKRDFFAKKIAVRSNERTEIRGGTACRVGALEITTKS
jgi:hypothetical protein